MIIKLSDNYQRLGRTHNFPTVVSTIVFSIHFSHFCTVEYVTTNYGLLSVTLKRDTVHSQHYDEWIRLSNNICLVFILVFNIQHWIVKAKAWGSPRPICLDNKSQVGPQFANIWLFWILFEVRQRCKNITREIILMDAK